MKVFRWAEAAIRAGDFAGLVPASRGAHCRPLHPRLASLGCRAGFVTFPCPLCPSVRGWLPHRQCPYHVGKERTHVQSLRRGR